MSKTMKTALAISAVSALLGSFAATAGTMGDASMGESGNFLLFEGGASYFYSLFENSVTVPESYTTSTPAGIISNPSKVYPNNIAGGYIELSLFKDSLLFNTRYDMYALKGVSSSGGTVNAQAAPARLSMTVDKTWEPMQEFVWGLGAGVALFTLNESAVYNYNPTAAAPTYTQIGTNNIGRARLDPLVEGIVMYKLPHNFNVRANVAYQIPEHNVFTYGSINVNLGINYALPL